MVFISDDIPVELQDDNDVKDGVVVAFQVLGPQTHLFTRKDRYTAIYLHKYACSFLCGSIWNISLVLGPFPQVSRALSAAALLLY